MEEGRPVCDMHTTQKERHRSSTKGQACRRDEHLASPCPTYLFIINYIRESNVRERARNGFVLSPRNLDTLGEATIDDVASDP